MSCGQLRIRVGPYTYAIKSNLKPVRDGIETLYGDFPVAGQNSFIDYRVAMVQDSLVSRLRKQVNFELDHQRPFAPIPQQQAYASLEWGMNWCVSTYLNDYLKLHAAVVAKDSAAMVMPGIPGAGKSTLCAAMGLSGWQVLSDEHAMICKDKAEVLPLYRPVSLKNASIDIIKTFDSSATFGPVCYDTHKGTVAHLKTDFTPASHNEQALPVAILLFPQYDKDAPQRISPRYHSDSFIVAAFHSFNYSLLGEAGFAAMSHLLDHVQCFDLVYHDLDWALHELESLHKEVTQA